MNTTTRQQSAARDLAFALGVIANAADEIMAESGGGSEAATPVRLVVQQYSGEWFASLRGVQRVGRDFPLFDPIDGHAALGGKGATIPAALADLGATLEAFYPPNVESEAVPTAYAFVVGDLVRVKVDGPTSRELHGAFGEVVDLDSVDYHVHLDGFGVRFFKRNVPGALEEAHPDDEPAAPSHPFPVGARVVVNAPERNGSPAVVGLLGAVVDVRPAVGHCPRVYVVQFDDYGFGEYTAPGEYLKPAPADAPAVEQDAPAFKVGDRVVVDNLRRSSNLANMEGFKAEVMARDGFAYRIRTDGGEVVTLSPSELRADPSLTLSGAFSAAAVEAYTPPRVFADGARVMVRRDSPRVMAGTSGTVTGYSEAADEYRVSFSDADAGDASTYGNYEADELVAESAAIRAENERAEDAEAIERATEAAINAAAAVIQEHLGEDTGDFAAGFFSDGEQRAEFHGFAGWIGEYLRAQRADNAARDAAFAAETVAQVNAERAAA